MLSTESLTRDKSTPVRNLRLESQEFGNSSFGRTLQVAAIASSLAAFSFPARAQTNDSADAVPVVAQPAFTRPATSTSVTTPSQITNPTVSVPVQNQSDQQKVETPTKSDTRKLFGMTALIASIASTGYYWLRLHRRETVGDISNLALQTSNNGLLAIAAISMGQGLSGAGALIGFTVLGFCCLHTSWKLRSAEWKVSDFDLGCTLCCVAGWTLLIASYMPAIKQYVASDSLAFVSSIIGTVVNTITCLPLMRTMFAAPKAGEAIPQSQGRFRAVFGAVSPFLLGTVALGSTLGAAILAVNQTNEFTLLQPIGLILNNLTLVTGTTIWALRRTSR